MRAGYLPLALKMCGHLQDAEDIAQETFLNAFRYLKDFREETKLKNWLFQDRGQGLYEEAAKEEMRTGS